MDLLQDAMKRVPEESLSALEKSVTEVWVKNRSVIVDKMMDGYKSYLTLIVIYPNHFDPNYRQRWETYWEEEGMGGEILTQMDSESNLRNTDTHFYRPSEFLDIKDSSGQRVGFALPLIVVSKGSIYEALSKVFNAANEKVCRENRSFGQDSRRRRSFSSLFLSYGMVLSEPLPDPERAEPGPNTTEPEPDPTNPFI